jgi:hypothetical protein
MDNTMVGEKSKETTFTEIQQKFFGFIRRNVYEIIIVFVCLAFMLKGVADIQKTGASVIEIIGNGFITLLFSLSLCRLLEGKGFFSGEQSDEYKEALVEYKKERKKAGEYIKEMDEWCAEWTKKNHKDVISVKLYPFGISYEDFIANTYDTSKFTEAQIRKLNALKKLKTMELTTDQLMSGDFDSAKQIDYKKTTKANYAKKSLRNDLISKTFLSLTLGYYVLAPFQQWNWSGFAWVFLQTVLILGFSVGKYFDAYSYVNGDIRAKVIDKTHKLRQFNKDKGVDNNGEGNEFIGPKRVD